jgi:thiamine biosynthesis lipoprotein
MGTTVGARIWLEDAEQAQRLLANVRLEMERINAAFSPYLPDSELSVINSRAHQAPQRVSVEMALLIAQSEWAKKVSGGAFDVTYASVGRLYNYREGTQPSGQDIDTALPAVGAFKFNKASRTLVFNHPKVALDFGGLAKGYAVERAVKLLANAGVKHASVHAGGDTQLLGNNRGRPWIVGIKNPRPKNADKQWDSVIKLPLANEAISTSGDYERYFIDEATGARVHHIINPRTGKSTDELMSVSVIGPSGFVTDPLSTAIFVMGANKGLAMINKVTGYEAILITRTGEVLYSAGLESADN